MKKEMNMPELQEAIKAEQEPTPEEKRKRSRKAKLAATGIKESVANMDAVAEAEKKEPAKAKAAAPSLFVSDDQRIRIHVEVLYDPTNGKPLMIAAVPEDRTETPLKYLSRTREWFEFTHPTYDDMVGYRETSMSYDSQNEKFLTDPVKLRLCFLRYHLADWSLKGQDGEKVELKRMEGKMLTGDSMQMIGRIMPALLDVVMTEFEKETLLGT